VPNLEEEEDDGWNGQSKGCADLCTPYASVLYILCTYVARRYAAVRESGVMEEVGSRGTGGGGDRTVPGKECCDWAVGDFSDPTSTRQLGTLLPYLIYKLPRPVLVKEPRVRLEDE
jgi:hypothetical protein